MKMILYYTVYCKVWKVCISYHFSYTDPRQKNPENVCLHLSQYLIKAGKRHVYYETVCITQQSMWDPSNVFSNLKSCCLIWVDHMYYMLCNGLLQRQLVHIFCKLTSEWDEQISWMFCVSPPSTEWVCMIILG